MANTTNLNIDQILGSDDEFYRKFKENIQGTLRVATPAIVQSFNSEEQTVTAQVAIRELVIQADQSKVWTDISLLLDVPIVILRAGNYCITFPVKAGDEGLIIFADRCIDAWWSYGGVQNQLELRKHSLSDGIFIPGLYSQPNRIENYSKDTMELRSLDGNTKISLKENEININATTIKMNGIDVTPIS